MSRPTDSSRCGAQNDKGDRQTSYAGQHVVILGMARQGTAAARFFLAQGAR